MGKSGSGKSTLLNILGGMMSVDSGEYLYDGKAVNFKNQRELTGFRRNEVEFVVQYFALADDLNVFHNVALPLKYQGVPRKKVKQMVRDALQQLGIADKEKAYPSELSGGQQQRVAIGRALMNAPAVMLADEPTGALDSKNGQEIVRLLKESNQKYGQTLLLVTHDENIALQAERIVTIADGKVVRDSKEKRKTARMEGQSAVKRERKVERP